MQHPPLVLLKGSVQTEANLFQNYLLQNQNRRQYHSHGVGCRSFGRLVVQPLQWRLTMESHCSADLPLQQRVNNLRHQHYVSKSCYSFWLFQAIRPYPCWVLDESQSSFSRVLSLVCVQQLVRFLLFPIQQASLEAKKPTPFPCLFHRWFVLNPRQLDTISGDKRRLFTRLRSPTTGIRQAPKATIHHPLQIWLTCHKSSNTRSARASSNCSACTSGEKGKSYGIGLSLNFSKRYIDWGLLPRC